MSIGSGLPAVEQHLRRLHATAAQIRHAGRTIFQLGDVSRPVHVHSIRKSILSALFGEAHDRGQVDLGVTLGALGIEDSPVLS
jgi:hypothetical protein